VTVTTAKTPCRTTTGKEKLCSGGSDPVPGNGWPGHSSGPQAGLGPTRPQNEVHVARKFRLTPLSVGKSAFCQAMERWRARGGRQRADQCRRIAAITMSVAVVTANTPCSRTTGSGKWCSGTGPAHQVSPAE
jgi:hypothetical protein